MNRAAAQTPAGPRLWKCGSITARPRCFSPHLAFRHEIQIVPRWPYSMGLIRERRFGIVPLGLLSPVLLEDSGGLIQSLHLQAVSLGVSALLRVGPPSHRLDSPVLGAHLPVLGASVRLGHLYLLSCSSLVRPLSFSNVHPIRTKRPAAQIDEKGQGFVLRKILSLCTLPIKGDNQGIVPRVVSTLYCCLSFCFSAVDRYLLVR